MEPSSSRGDLLALIASPLRAVGQRYGGLPLSPSEPLLDRKASDADSLSSTGSSEDILAASPPGACTPPRPSSAAAAYTAVLDRASQLLPAALSKRLASATAGAVVVAGRGPEPAPPVQVAVHPRRGPTVLISVTQDVTLEALQRAAGKATGGVAANFEFVVAEENGPPGFKELLRSTAGQLSHRQRAKWAVLDGVDWLFVPQSISAELRGSGLLAWLDRHVLANLREPGADAALPVAMHLATGRRTGMVLPRDAALARLRRDASQRAGILPERQQLTLRERRAHTPTEEAFWAAARLFLAYVLILLRCVGLILGIIDPLADAPLRLRLETRTGRSVMLTATRDMTLHQLSELALEQHGEELNLDQIVLTPVPETASKPRSDGGGSPLRQRLFGTTKNRL